MTIHFKLPGVSPKGKTMCGRDVTVRIVATSRPEDITCRACRKKFLAALGVQRRNLKWTGERAERAEKMWKAGAGPAEIAKELGCNSDAVKNFIRRKGIAREAHS